MHIVEGGLDDHRVVGLLEHHLGMARSVSPPGSSHALDLDGLRRPEVRFWSLWDGDALLGVGALKQIEAGHGEIKSMHTAESARGRGAGTALLLHIIAQARAQGLTRLSLETGVQPYFQPAVALYAKYGFVACPPYKGYTIDPASLFMTLELTY